MKFDTEAIAKEVIAEFTRLRRDSRTSVIPMTQAAKPDRETVEAIARYVTAGTRGPNAVYRMLLLASALEVVGHAMDDDYVDSLEARGRS